MRICPIAAGVVATLVLTACGGSSGSSGASSGSGGSGGRGVHPGAGGNSATVHARFPVKVTTASFPASQRLAQPTKLVIAVRNAGHRALPDVAVSICNTSCAPSSKGGVGTAAAAFGQDVSGGPGVANPTRPVWIIDRGPGACAAPCDNPGGESGSSVTASSNTWSLGRLAPGRTARFQWSVTAAAAGHHVVAWQIAGDLTGDARATLDTGGPARGRFTVDVLRRPLATRVKPNGSLVTSPKQ
jgi:hypothetical protein